MENDINKKLISALEYEVTGACIEIHKNLGPGLLESVYHRCLERELQLRDIFYVSEHIIDIEYKGVSINTALRVDLLVENCLIMELKSVETIHPIYEAQILTYMKLLNVPKGLLINFNCTNIIHNGKKTFVNELYRDLL
ncbi:GxxExxY protein [Pedobacter chitinilyticus]|uniref:GxxExxY protein n=1 Tax=Pedobacter chitinilyticus TaxID=2233776 RepID=A0A443YZW4_9SPHI|nr:GxxExxY protein [Pedobacter chitinilyticus]RWU09837.1 GxxExxY protein [Pedobacter chitinilyticus]